jgi:hypothetical protein
VVSGEPKLVFGKPKTGSEWLFISSLWAPVEFPH